MKRYSIRPATIGDILDFYGFYLPYSSKTWAIDYDGELAAIAGVQFCDRTAIAFGHIDEEVDAPDMAVFRAAKEIMKKIAELGIEVKAICDQDTYPNAHKFLKKLGFAREGVSSMGEVFTWPIH